ncbi:MAG: hypothetical protein A2X86_14485 [Bdellovibrionales bacterium GWA2_49_15]|nr:MAG: hypothetical protein A2X86_14485 [Bdellovibrionales bacterium GWA2_49_15]HAZ13824.1 hypothetical protein [Bdellovibrionales bacterium]
MKQSKVRMFFRLGFGILAILGTLHAALTCVDIFRPLFFRPHEAFLIDAMAGQNLVFAAMFMGNANMWSAWLGFSIGMGMGALFTGMAGLYVTRDGMIPNQTMRFFGIGVALHYVVLAAFFWFYLPLIGFTISLTSFVIAEIFARGENRG